MHTCPGPQCQAQVDDSMLACARHWFQVPKPLRTAVWRAWDGGAGKGLAAHNAAIVAAVGTMRPLAR